MDLPAEVAEVDFTAFAAQKKAEQVPGRLVVRRIPDFNAEKNRAAGQDTLFDVWRFHAFFTTADPTMHDTVAADTVHRGHAIIEQVHADLKNPWHPSAGARGLPERPRSHGCECGLVRVAGTAVAAPFVGSWPLA